MGIILWIVGFICILYCLAIFLFAGHGTNFYLLWGVIGLFLILWAGFGNRVVSVLPGWLKKLCVCFILLGAVIFLLVEALVISGFFAKGEKGLDYIIVLGAQLKENGPSYVLQKRLDEAYEYLIENEETKVIVSGGQGSDEPDTEAQGMYEYLVARGISPERIMKEDESKNTSQNIRFSARLFNPDENQVGIVTSDFHIYRAVRLAKAAGYENVCGIAAPSHPGLLINNMFREFMGIMKDFLVGNFR